MGDKPEAAGSLFHDLRCSGIWEDLEQRKSNQLAELQQNQPWDTEARRQNGSGNADRIPRKGLPAQTVATKHKLV